MISNLAPNVWILGVAPFALLRLEEVKLLKSEIGQPLRNCSSKSLQGEPPLATEISKLKGIYRIGPHDKDILSVIFGSLLGNAQAQNRGGAGTTISFFQEDFHLEYILFLHKFLSVSGYCNPKIPVVTKRLGAKGKVRKVIKFSTWTYTSFSWIHDIWYEGNRKRVPLCIGEYLTPLALAIWIMDGGKKESKGLRFLINSFTYNECLMLVNVLSENLNLKSSVQSAGSKNRYILYIWKESMDDLRNIVSPYILPGMKYKL